MLDCEREVMKGLSNEQLIYIIEQLLRSQKLISAICVEESKWHINSDEAVEQIRRSLYNMPSIDSRTLPAYIDMQLGKITNEEFRCVFLGV